jgi:hypothetical protein
MAGWNKFDDSDLGDNTSSLKGSEIDSNAGDKKVVHYGDMKQITMFPPTNNKR